MTLNFAQIFYWFVLTEILKTELTHEHEARLGALRWELLCFDEKNYEANSEFSFST